MSGALKLLGGEYTEKNSVIDFSLSPSEVDL